MPLTNREKLIVLITNTITLYAERMEAGKIPPNQSVLDFILKSIPEDLKSEITMDLIDDILLQI